jgi:hypothetical protein
MDRSPTHRRTRERARRLGAGGVSAGLHVGLLLVLLAGWRSVAPPAPPLDIPVSLAPALTPPAPPAAPKPPSSPPKAKAVHVAATREPAARPTPPPPPALVARRSRARPTPISPPAVRAPSTAARASLDQLVDAQLAGARAEGGGAGAGYGQGAGEGQGTGQGGGGGQCDMAARVQAALRKDPLARAAVHAAGGGAIVVWNGDWVQATTEDGKGLAAVREAITWEVAFAPAACRLQRVRGPVLLSLNDGSARLTVGAGEWRWSDLLGLR